MIIGNRNFDAENHTYVMGILNYTPDSFSDGGRFNHMDSALRHTEEMIKEGADIIDVGGESTRPGHIQISEEEEIARVVPVIRRIKENFDIPVSIDTYKSSVADAAVSAGADLINDIWGCKYDKEIANVIAKRNVPCCLMHNRNLKEQPYGKNMMEDILNDLRDSIEIARQAGVRDEMIITDPGIGFGKTLEHNLITMNHLERFKELGYPVLLGTSRKSMIGLTLDLPCDERLEGTIATTVIGVMKGCAFIRVHDVLANKRAVMMTEAIMKEGN